MCTHLLRREDVAGQEHALADEIGDEAVRGPVVEVVGAVPLLDLARVHDADLVGDGERLVLVVRDQDRGGAGALDDVAHLARELFAQLDVEVRERLVEQQQVGLRRQRARQRDALLLSARQLVRILVPVAGEPDDLDALGRAPHALGAGAAVQPEGDVVGDGEMREQGVVLEHHADAALLRGHGQVARRDHLAGDADLAARHRLEAGDAAQDGGLAAARGAEQAADVAARERERQPAHDLVLAVRLSDGVELQHDGARFGTHGVIICSPAPLRKQELMESLYAVRRLSGNKNHS